MNGVYGGKPLEPERAQAVGRARTLRAPSRARARKPSPAEAPLASVAHESLSPVERADLDRDDGEPVVGPDRPLLERAPDPMGSPPLGEGARDLEQGAVPPLDELLDVAAVESPTDADALLDGSDADGDGEDEPGPTPPALVSLEGSIVGGILRASRGERPS